MANKRGTYMSDMNIFELPMATMAKVNDATRLCDIADRVNHTSKAELQYNELLKDATDAAEHGRYSISVRKLKEAMYLENLRPDSVPAGKTREEFAHELYLEQDGMFDMCRKHGFTVTEKDPKVSSLFSIGLDPAMQQRAEMEAAMIRRSVDKDVTISWGRDDSIIK